MWLEACEGPVGEELGSGDREFEAFRLFPIFSVLDDLLSKRADSF